MKKLKSTKKSNQIDRDFAAVCKKHKLEKVAIAIQIPVPDDKTQYTIMSSCHIRRKKGGIEEKRFCIAIARLFSQFGFLPKNIDMAASILKAQLERYKPSKEELALSESDQKKLFSIRKKKMKFVHEKKYEEASKLRDEERKLIGTFQEPKESHKGNPAFDIESIHANISDIEAVSRILFDAAKEKNWKIDNKKTNGI